MATANIYNFEGKAVDVMELPSAVFEVKTNSGLMHEVVIGLMANDRQVTSHTKTRGEVSGGGKKPWKQKGTGRARAGSIRSPLWRGGGVTFGPRSDRNFKVKINKKAKQSVFKMVLSEKVADKALIIMDNFDLENAKTKAFSAILKKLPIVGKKVLVVFPEGQSNIRLASRNIPKLTQSNLVETNIMDVMRANTVLTTKSAVEQWVKTYNKK